MEGLMFDKLRNKKRELPPLFSESELDELSPAVNFNTVLEWLIGLGDDDYIKVVNVSDIHRKAYAEAAKVLGEPLDPTTFINPPAPDHLSPVDMSMANQYAENVDHPTRSTILDDDDISSAFLEDDQDSAASAKQHKTAQKATNIASKVTRAKIKTDDK